LYDALRTEGDAVLATEPLEITVQPVGGAGEYGRAQDYELIVVEVRQQIVDALLHRGGDRVEEFIDRRADGDHDRARAADRRRGRTENQLVLGQGLGEQRGRAVFDEGQLACAERRQRRFVEVVDVNRHPRLGEGQHERNTDMAGAAHHT